MVPVELGNTVWGMARHKIIDWAVLCTGKHYWKGMGKMQTSASPAPVRMLTTSSPIKAQNKFHYHAPGPGTAAPKWEGRNFVGLCKTPPVLMPEPRTKLCETWCLCCSSGGRVINFYSGKSWSSIIWKKSQVGGADGSWNSVRMCGGVSFPFPSTRMISHSSQLMP